MNANDHLHAYLIYITTRWGYMPRWTSHRPPFSEVSLPGCVPLLLCLALLLLGAPSHCHT